MRIIHEDIIYYTRTFEAVISVKVILDTDGWKDKAKDIYQRIGQANEVIDNRIDKVSTWLGSRFDGIF